MVYYIVYHLFIFKSWLIVQFLVVFVHFFFFTLNSTEWFDFYLFIATDFQLALSLSLSCARVTVLELARTTTITFYFTGSASRLVVVILEKWEVLIMSSAAAATSLLVTFTTIAAETRVMDIIVVGLELPNVTNTNW